MVAKKKNLGLFASIKKYKRDKSKKDYIKLLLMLSALFLLIPLTIAIVDSLTAIEKAISILSIIWFAIYTSFYSRSVHLLYENNGIVKHDFDLDEVENAIDELHYLAELGADVSIKNISLEYVLKQTKIIENALKIRKF